MKKYFLLSAFLIMLTGCGNTSVTNKSEIVSNKIVSDTTANTNETFYGVLIDEDCSDFEDPPAHDLPCMLMYSCRDSGYGLDIEQSGDTWDFIPFDKNGNDLAWKYLNEATKQDSLFVTVTGKIDNDTIIVSEIKEN